MPTDSKNLKDDLARIPDESGNKEILQLPPEIALSSKITDYENQNIVFTFLQYKHSQCEISDLQRNEAKRLTERLKDVSKIIPKRLLFSQSSGVDCKPVHKGGQYACLFTDLPTDAQLLEIDYTNTGRIFGYLVNNIFNIVVVKRKHLK